ncbi:MAG: SUMF1/EgtB/PvdO family nonheme iron enzyme [Planctomycetota bacterium]
MITAWDPMLDTLLRTAPFVHGYKTLGLNRIKNLMRRTGIGAVYLAESDEYNVDVALDIFPVPARQGDPEQFLAAYRTAMAPAMALSSPGLVAMFDIATANHLIYTVSEYVHGDPLKDAAARQHPLSDRQALEWLAPIADALSVSHQAGVIHGNLAPERIVIDPNARARVGDTGALIAYHVARYGDSLPDGPCGNAPHYMSPEHTHSVSALLPASDVWSFGMILFEILAGKLPWIANDDAAWVEAVRTAPAPDVRQFNPAVGEATARLVSRALAKSPTERFPDGAALNAALQQALNGTTQLVGIQPPSHTRLRGRTALFKSAGGPPASAAPSAPDATQKPSASGSARFRDIKRPAGPPTGPNTAVRFGARPPSTGNTGVRFGDQPAGRGNTGIRFGARPPSSADAPAIPAAPDAEPASPPAAPPAAPLTTDALSKRISALRLKEMNYASLLSETMGKEYDAYKKQVDQLEDAVFERQDLNGAPALLQDVEMILDTLIDIVKSQHDARTAVLNEFTPFRASMTIEADFIKRYNPVGYDACKELFDDAERAIKAADYDKAGRFVSALKIEFEKELVAARQASRDIKKLQPRLQSLKELEATYHEVLEYYKGDRYARWNALYPIVYEQFRTGDVTYETARQIDELDETLNAAINDSKRMYSMQLLYNKDKELVETFNRMRRESEAEKNILSVYNPQGLNQYREHLKGVSETLITVDIEKVDSAVRESIDLYAGAEAEAVANRDLIQALNHKLADLRDLWEDNATIFDRFPPVGYAEFKPRLDEAAQVVYNYLRSPAPDINETLDALQTTLDALVVEAKTQADAEMGVARQDIAKLEEAVRLNPRDRHTTMLLDKARSVLGPAETMSLDAGKGLSISCVLIRAGKFIMGSPETEAGRSADELEHVVRISRPFYIGVMPVTQEQFYSIMNINPSNTKGDNHPVEEITWQQAMEFCARLSRLTEQSVTLPTEAQWEFAARAGTDTAYFFGDDAFQLGKYAWFSRNAARKTHPVGEKLPSPNGLYDIYGNVLEWCRDYYDEGYYAGSPRRDPGGPSGGEGRALRGGCWHRDAEQCRSAARAVNVGVERSSSFGFRIIVEIRETSG